MGIVWKLKPYRDLTADEVYEMLRLRTEVFVVEQNCAYREIDGKDRLAYHLFAEEDGRILAYLRILPKGISFPEIALGRIVTHPAYRGKGYAGELIQRAIRFVTEDLGEREIRISAQTRLDGFYRRLGFRPVSDPYLEDGIEHWEMYWSLGE